MNKVLLPEGYESVIGLNTRLHTESEEIIEHKAGDRAVKLFKDMARSVPAYKDFLKKNRVSPSKINTIDDFQLLPKLDKDNYLRAYPRESLCWNGEFGKGRWSIATTSGSTGKPYYFPRQITQDLQYAICAELYLRNNFAIQDKRTLYIVAFPMGAWIGGVFTYEALRQIADRGEYDLSIITPGIDKNGVIDAVVELGDSFDQIIIGAYAPFLKDILDDGAHRGVKWEKYDLGFVFSAEAFSETFRDYVIDKVQAENEFSISLNHYGTVDQGTLAHETPESVLIRRSLVEEDKLSVIFPEKHRQPTLAQYNPELFYFEQAEENLLCSTYSGIPLVRYDLKDYGGVISKQKLHRVLASSGISVDHELKKNNLMASTWNLPFVYVYERNDFSVSYYAFLIYPDTIRRAIQRKEFDKLVTGKFAMKVDYDKSGRQQLLIHVEEKKAISLSHKSKDLLKVAIHDGLLKESSEYRETFKMMGDIVKPTLKFWDYEHGLYFRPGGKQKWVIK